MKVVDIREIGFETTGAGYTTVFSHQFHYQVFNGKLKPCPVHIEIIKGYSNSRHVYQLINVTRPVVTLVFEGSANPNTGPTPEELLNVPIEELILIRLPRTVSKKELEMINDAITENIEVLERAREYMYRHSPGRECLTPPNAEFVENITVEYSWFDTAVDYIAQKYPVHAPGWFRGGRVKLKGSRVIWDDEYPVRQGNCIVTPWLLGPAVAGHGSPVWSTGDRVVVRGNEGNDHVVYFDGNVHIAKLDDQNFLVYAPELVNARVTHPQHDPVTFQARGLFRVTHVRSRYE